jgi:hypothetical protein
MFEPAESATTLYCSGNSPTMSSVCVPMEPVEPISEMGLAPVQLCLATAGASARPGHAGGTTTEPAAARGASRRAEARGA